MAAFTTSMPSIHALATAKEVITPRSGKSLSAMHVTSIPCVELTRLAPLAAGMGTRAIPALAGTPDHLFAGNPDETYDEYMGNGMRLLRARDAMTNDDNPKRGRWQYATRIKADAWGVRPALP